MNSASKKRKSSKHTPRSWLTKLGAKSKANAEKNGLEAWYMVASDEGHGFKTTFFLTPS